MIGYLPDVSGDYTLSVALYPANDLLHPVREVRASRPNDYSGICADYAGMTVWGGVEDDVRRSGMPDLVYDPLVADSFGDAWRKCFYGDGYFAASFAGGVYRGDVRLRAEDGTPYTSLEAGDYVIVATAVGSGRRIQGEKRIRVGVTADKLCSRFSPNGHYVAVKAFAAENGLRVYDDPFAGYWTPSSNHREGMPEDMSIEIEPKWRKAEHQEYAQETVHVVLYNVSPTSTTQRVEMGIMQYLQRLDTGVFYHYDIGEPSLSFADEVRNGRIVSFAEDDYHEAVRLDAASASDSDNLYDLTSQPAVVEPAAAKDWNLSAFDGDSVALYGVVRPLQNAPAQIVSLDSGIFEVERRIEGISYTFVDERGTVLSRDVRSVGLTRKYAADYLAESIYEYRHVMNLSDFGDAAVVRVESVALDDGGVEIAGSAEAIRFMRQPVTSSSSGCAGGWGIAPLLLLSMFIWRKSRRTA